MDTLTIPRPPQQGKAWQLHIPSFTTMSCVQCGAAITTLAEWLNSECGGGAAAPREAA